MRRIICGMVCAVLMLCTACAVSKAPYSEKSDVLLQTAIEAINADDTDALMALYSDALQATDIVQLTVRQGLEDFTDTIESFSLIGSDTTEHSAYGSVLYKTVSHYDLFSATAHYTAFLSFWHADGEVGYPNAEEMGLHTLRIVEDADYETQYNGLLNETMEAGVFHYTPSRLYAQQETYKGDFCVKDEEGMVWLTNAHVQSASALWETSGEGVSYAAVRMVLTDEGTEQFAEATRRNLYKSLPMYIGETRIAEPIVQAVIENGEIVLSGSDLLPTYADAESLAAYFNAYGKE